MRQEPKETPTTPGEVMKKVVPSIPQELAQVISAGARANRLVPSAVATGDSICALYSHHRISIDVDFVVQTLRERFDEVRELLLDHPDWREARVRAPNFIGGSLDQVEIGFRQQHRQTPIETVEIQTAQGGLLIPTVDEMIRIKALLAYERNYIRDFVDFSELASLLPRSNTISAILEIDAKFGWERRPTVILEVIKALVHCEPRDYDTHGFGTLRLLTPTLKSWEAVKETCQEIGETLAETVIEGRDNAS